MRTFLCLNTKERETQEQRIAKRLKIFREFNNKEIELNAPETPKTSKNDLTSPKSQNMQKTEKNQLESK